MRMWTFVLFSGLMLAAGAAAPAISAADWQRLLDRPRDWSRDAAWGDAGPQETETIDRTVALPANGTVRIKSFSGDVRITPASGGNVIVKAIRRARRETLDHVKLDVSTSGSVVTIEANRREGSWVRSRDGDVVHTQLEIQVPPSADLDIDTFSSDVSVDGMNGDQRIKTFSGEITVRGLKGEIDAETFSADIHVALGAASKGSVSFDSFSGRLDSDVALTTLSYDSRRGRGRRARRIEGTLPGGEGPRLRFHTFSGDVDLRTN